MIVAKMFCITPSKGYKLLKVSQEKYQKEVQITNLLKQIRVFNGYIRSKVSEKEWKRLWKKHSIQLLDIDETKPNKQDPLGVVFDLDSFDTDSFSEECMSSSQSAS